VWNGILEHFPQMGMAIWLFLWCLDKIIYEQDGVGHVLGGAPVKVAKIAAELARSERAIRRDFGDLRSKYLKLRWTPYGYVIEVLNSQKFGIWKPLDSQATNGEARGKSGEARTKNGRAVTEFGRSKEDSAVAAVDAAVRQPAPPGTSNPQKLIWSFLGIEPCGPLSFRELLESRWASRNGHRPSVVIGETIDVWEIAEGEKLRRVPRLFGALSELREKEKQQSVGPVHPGEPIHVLKPEEIPA
jgi:hypothetical protein